jgi:hypothetical protein
MPKISDFLPAVSTDATSLIPIVEVGTPNRNKTISVSDFKAQLFTPATVSALGAVKIGTSLTVSGAGLLDVATPLPSQTGNANKFLKTDGAGNLSWAASTASNQFARVITPEIEGTNNLLAIYSSWVKDTGISIVSETNLESVTLTSDRLVAITTDVSATPKNWIFGTNGTITWPDSTVQSTAHPLDVIMPDSTLIQGVATLVLTGAGVTASSAGNAVTLDITGGGSPTTGNFIFSANDASLPLGNDMTLSTYQNGGNKESKLTLSTSGISSLDVGNNLRITTGYGTGFEKVWTFGADGSLRLPDNTVLNTPSNGLSAYEIAVSNGFVGNESAWLASLVGAPGLNGQDGLNGDNGMDGATGADAVWFWQGEYNDTTVYVEGDIVTQQGNAYRRTTVALGASGESPYPFPGGYWDLVASKGSDGSDGVAGQDGADGSFSNILTTVAKTGGAQVTPTAIDLTQFVNKLSSTSGGYYTLADGVEGQIMYLTQQDAIAGMYVNVANARIDGTLDTNAELTFSAVNGNVITLLFIDGAWQQGGGEWAA